jgi:hypothetical protein
LGFKAIEGPANRKFHVFFTFVQAPICDIPDRIIAAAQLTQ